MVEKLKSVRLHAEEKGHWIVAFGYASSATFWGGHNAVVTGLCYAIAAGLATHATVARSNRKQAEKNDN